VGVLSANRPRQERQTSDLKLRNPYPNPNDLPISQLGVAGDCIYTWGLGEVFAPEVPKPGMRKVFEHVKSKQGQAGMALRQGICVLSVAVRLRRTQERKPCRPWRIAAAGACCRTDRSRST